MGKPYGVPFVNALAWEVCKPSQITDRYQTLSGSARRSSLILVWALAGGLLLNTESHFVTSGRSHLLKIASNFVSFFSFSTSPEIMKIAPDLMCLFSEDNLLNHRWFQGNSARLELGMAWTYVLFTAPNIYSGWLWKNCWSQWTFPRANSPFRNWETVSVKYWANWADESASWLYISG